MKKTILLIFAFSAITNLTSQELNGVWLSNENLIDKSSNTAISEDGVSIIDFDKDIMAAINANYSKSVKTNKKETTIKIKGIKGKLKIHKLGKDSLILANKSNIRYVFKKLNDSYKFDMNANDVSNFLLNQHCGTIQDIQAEFKKEQFFLDKKSNKPRKRFQVINYSKRDNGYWYIKKLNTYTLLVFTTEQNTAENIFQISSLDLKGFKLNQLFSDNHIKDLTAMKTCLEVSR